MRKEFNKYIFIAISSLFVLFATLFISVTVKSQMELNNVWIGYPISFVNQNLHYNPPTFPRNYGLSSIWENPTKIVWTNLIASYLLLFLAIYILVILYNKAKLLKS